MGRVPIIVGSGLLGLLFLIGVTLGDPQEATDGVGPLMSRRLSLLQRRRMYLLPEIQLPPKKRASRSRCRE